MLHYVMPLLDYILHSGKICLSMNGEVNSTNEHISECNEAVSVPRHVHVGGRLRVDRYRSAGGSFDQSNAMPHLQCASILLCNPKLTCLVFSYVFKILPKRCGTAAVINLYFPILDFFHK